MKPGLDIGVQAELDFEVSEAMCPSFDGVVVHHVCSTWSLVHQMEVAGRKLLVPFLEAGEEGVGSHASCDHLGPAPVGSQVRVVATAADVSDRRLVCDLVAFRGDRMIASGRTVQQVYPREVLAKLLGERA